MADIEREDEFDTKTENFTHTAADQAQPGDLVVIETEKMSQLTELDISAGESNTFRVDIRDQDSSNPETVLAFHGSTIKEGDFEKPAFEEIGAQKETAVRLDSEGSSGVDYAVNVRVDEHTG